MSIPTMRDRATQSLVKHALEPEWKARFEPNSYGFRPGRSCHDAIQAICQSICNQAKWCYDADIAKCFDRIAREPLLEKMQTSPTLRRQIQAWLSAGVMDRGELFPTESGTPQGGCISPLLANIALHGMEKDLINHCRPLTKTEPRMVRYADDFVILHKDKAIIEECQRYTTEWLKQMGLEPKPSKTRVLHTLEASEQAPGFDFLGFKIRQHPAGKTRSAKRGRIRGILLGFKTHIKPSKAAVQKHVDKLHEILRRNRAVDQELLITLLAPILVGWCNYFAIYACGKTFAKLNCVLFAMLMAWASRRHSEKGKRWVVDKYWRVNDGGGWRFQPRRSARRLPKHTDTRVKQHTKVAGSRSPYDGDWVYWSTRMGRETTTPTRVARLLREQGGRCPECGLYFRSDDRMEVDHVHPRAHQGTGARQNLQLLHRHCHDRKTDRDKRCA